MKILQLSGSRKLVIKNGRGIQFIPLEDIAYVVADNNYSKVILSEGGELLVSNTLKCFEKELRSFEFIRCHKSYLVNIEYIDELRCNGENKLRLSINQVIPVSREGLKRIKKKMVTFVLIPET